jgi:hypothetical protein
MRKVLPVIVVIALPAIVLIGGMSCQKTYVPPPPASIFIVNAMAGSNQIVPNFGTDTVYRYYKGPSSATTMVKISYGASVLYTRTPATTSLSVVPITDTVFKIFNGTLDLASGAIYSFFLSGDTAHADTMMIKENIPSYSDSSTGVRFVNLSIGGKALVINLVGDSGNLQFPAIGYQGVTDFRKYSAVASAGTSYKFEIRDQATGTLLKTYTWTFRRFRNNTIVISGDPTIPAQFKVFAINHY